MNIGKKCQHFIHNSHSTQAPPPSYLHQPVLRPEPGVVGGGPGVQGADVLPGPGPVAVEVEAVAGAGARQVAQTRGELRRVGLGWWLRFSRDGSLLEENGGEKQKKSVCSCFIQEEREKDTNFMFT